MINCYQKCILSGMKRLARRSELALGTKIDPKTLGYAPIFRPGKYINSGMSANVYEVEGYPNLVILIRKYVKKYCPLSMKIRENAAYGIVASNKHGVEVMKKLPGTPLHGIGWNSKVVPNIQEYKKTLKTLSELPDSTYEKYIDDVAELRRKGYRIDIINPNNYLIDLEKGEINICDIAVGSNYKNYANVEDFYPFLDANRLQTLMKNSTLEERKEISEIIRKFLDRIGEIGKRKGLNLSVEAVNPDKTQHFIVHVYNGNESRINELLKETENLSTATKNMNNTSTIINSDSLAKFKHIIERPFEKSRKSK